MDSLQVQEILEWITRLGTSTTYQYYSGKSSLRIIEVTHPEGPIRISRWQNRNGEESATEAGISQNMLATVASVFSRKPNYPIHFDRLFSGGGNSRSALETLLALTPQFYICFPRRTSLYNGTVDRNSKHLMWCPDDAHTLGEIHTKEYEHIISEVEYEVDFGNIRITNNDLSDEFTNIEAKRTHTQIQVALVRIGTALNFKSWIANNDRSIMIENTRLRQLPGVISTLEDIDIFYSAEIKRYATNIDCIWFSNDFRYIPAVIEVEHSTGVTSGLTRMLKLRESCPAINMNFTIVAEDTLRNKVVSEANTTAFRSLETRFMSYATVKELYGLIQRYNLTNAIERKFIEPFMERVVD